MTDAIDLPPPPPPPAPVPAGWEGILSPGEQILWQGRPGTGADWGLLLHSSTLFGLFFAGFAVFWIGTALSMMGGAGDSVPPMFRLFFPLFGIPFVLVGLSMAFGPLLSDWIERKGTYYTLTDRAAFIARSALGRRQLDRYALDEEIRPMLEDGDPGSVWFQGVAGGGPLWAGIRVNGRRYTPPPRRIGFRRVEDARGVYARMIAAQRALKDGRDGR